MPTGFIIKSQLTHQKPADCPPGVQDNSTKRVFYNRVPKCGSALTMTMFSLLAARHGWAYPEEKGLRMMSKPRDMMPRANQFWTNSPDTVCTVS